MGTRQDFLAPSAQGSAGAQGNPGYFTTGGVSNGGNEAVNGVIEKTRRLAHGFRNFTNYRIRILLFADGSRPYCRRSRIAPEPC